MFFLMKELIMGAILSQNHWRSQVVTEGTRAPLITMPPMPNEKQRNHRLFSLQNIIILFLFSRSLQF